MVRILTLCCLLLSSFHIHSQNKIGEQLFASGFEIAVDIIFDNDNTMYVVEKRGKIQLVDADGNKASSPFLDITNRVNSSANERGLLGLALDPDFANNGFIYVHYTTLTNSVISRFSSDGSGNADPDSEEIILTVGQPFNNHNAGALHFGPDGYLYIAMGDGGSGGDPGNRSQNRLTLLGKMLRIDVSSLPYTIPTDNPFAEDDFTLDEIWALGLRNPWKFSFDQLTGDMYIADVGQKAWEEVNFVKNGREFGLNFGWRCYEGFAPFNTSGCNDASTYEPPVYVYANNENNLGCSITGGYVYRGSIPYLYGRYIYGDFCTGNIWALSQNECGDWINELIYSVPDQELSTFGQDADGEIYIGKLGAGTITKITELCSLSTNILVTSPNCGQADGRIDVIPSDDQATINITGDKFIELVEGQYNITVADDQGCVNSFCVELTNVDSIAFPTLDGPDLVSICEERSILLSFDLLEASPDLSMDLYKDSVKIIEDWDGIYEFVESGTYSVVFYKGDCRSTLQDIVKIDIIQLPDLSITYSNNSLVASTGYNSYRWYENTQEVVGQTSNVLNNPKPSTSYIVEGIKNEGCAKLSDTFITTKTSDIGKEWGVSITPNPAYNYINISLKDFSDKDIKVVNIEGKTILHQKLNQSLTRIDVKDWVEGNYIVSISDRGDNIFSQTIIIQQ